MAGFLIIATGAVSGMAGLTTGFMFECGLQTMKFLAGNNALIRPVIWTVRLGVPSLLFVYASSNIKKSQQIQHHRSSSENFLSEASAKAGLIMGSIGFAVSVICTHSLSLLF